MACGICGKSCTISGLYECARFLEEGLVLQMFWCVLLKVCQRCGRVKNNEEMESND